MLFMSIAITFDDSDTHNNGEETKDRQQKKKLKVDPQLNTKMEKKGGKRRIFLTTFFWFRFKCEIRWFLLPDDDDCRLRVKFEPLNSLEF